MVWGILVWLLPVAMGALLFCAGLQDIRTREISNRKNAAIALLAPLWWMAIGLPVWPGMAVQVAVAALVFALFIGAFALGQMGGGDVKLIGALALWLPPSHLLDMLLVMSVIGGAITLAMLAERRLRSGDGTAAIEVPYGVAIALAGLLALREPLLNQFSL